MNKTTFVSYARDDRVVVEALVSDLKQIGCRVWFDQELSGGQSWWDRVLKEIRDSEVFVLALTPRSLKSEACLAEFKYAQNLGKAVLPVQLVNLAESPQPVAVAAIQQVDYRSIDKSAVMSLVGALSRLEPSPALPTPLPADPPLPISYRVHMTNEVSKPSLSYNAQLQLMMQLRDNLCDPELSADTRALLRQLQKRPDCSRTVFDDIERILSDTPAQPDPTGSLDSTSQKSNDAAETKTDLLGKVGSLIPALIAIGLVLAVSTAVIHNWLFGPRIEVRATSFDWSPKPVVVGQTVKLTGRYELTYRIRKGWKLDLDEVKGTPLPDVYTALWTIDGQTKPVEDARAVVTGESAQASIEVTFERPGLHSVEFDMRSRKSGSSDAKRKIPTQNIAVLAAPP